MGNNCNKMRKIKFYFLIFNLIEAASRPREKAQIQFDIPTCDVLRKKYPDLRSFNPIYSKAPLPCRLFVLEEKLNQIQSFRKTNCLTIQQIDYKNSIYEEYNDLTGFIGIFTDANMMPVRNLKCPDDYSYLKFEKNG